MNNFSIKDTSIDGLKIIEGTRYPDERGFFQEVFRKDSFREMGMNVDLYQANVSCSSKGVIRGLHYQKKCAQGKLVGVIKGAIFDVAVDLRQGSKTFGAWEGVMLTEDNRSQFYVPEGFAHGFLSLSDDTLVLYHCTDIYSPGEEAGICWNDPDLAIDWPMADVEQVLVSKKDECLPSFRSIVEEGWSYS